MRWLLTARLGGRNEQQHPKPHEGEPTPPSRGLRVAKQDQNFLKFPIGRGAFAEVVWIQSGLRTRSRESCEREVMRPVVS